uniref:Uncharacterized protein n=1 Tax=Arundo donax TaxID=35708 RepID=A0A0A9FI59_ARUDO
MPPQPPGGQALHGSGNADRSAKQGQVQSTTHHNQMTQSQI